MMLDAFFFTLFLLCSAQVNGLVFSSKRNYLSGRPATFSQFLSPHELDGDIIDTCEASLPFELDPNSEIAQYLLRDRLGLSDTQQQHLLDYAGLILEWNQRINLVSRRGCSLEVVFGRHILPCLAPVLLEDSIDANSKVIDVGTGGGFPGIPLAICYPDAEFLLVDSVGKKLKAVDEIVDRLAIKNVKTQHARAEDVVDSSFDWCVGRSVASLPTYCGWINHLLKPSTGRLLYVIGGDVPEAVLADTDESVHDLLVGNINDNNPLSDLDVGNISEKRLLIFPQAAVEVMAEASGIKNNKKRSRGSDKHVNNNRKKNAKGAWDKRDGRPKQRGYEDFQRYESNGS